MSKNAEKSNCRHFKPVEKVVKCPEVYFAVLLIFYEVFFHFVRVGGLNLNIVYKIFFAIFFGIIIGMIPSLVSKTAGKIVTIIFNALICFYFIAQIIYSGVFNTYLSLSGTMEVTGQALDYTDVIFSAVLHEWWIILILLLPLIFMCVWGRKCLYFGRHKPIWYAAESAVVFIVFLYLQVFMSYNNKGLYSAYKLYHDYTSVDLSVETLGVIETFYLDAKAGIKELAGGESEEPDFYVETFVPDDTSLDDLSSEDTSETGEITTEETPAVDTSPNVLPLDFDKLIEEAPDENIKSIHEYVRTVTPTNKNEYTGQFEGYNLIFIVAEGFSGYMIDPVRTPTLYKLSHEGFVFENYYTPLWYGSTLGGEYADLTGLIPENGSYLSMKKSGKNGNDMKFTLSRQLKNEGYRVLGYHNNDYKYYGRDVSHTNLGYDWIGVGNGLETEKSSSGNALWPQSDLYMVNQTMDDYMQNAPFYVYYLTVSGHVMYNFTGNAMAIRHKDIVEDLDYSETTKAYLACQYELELALTALVDKLEETGQADNTLIVLTADHVPYDNKDVLDELAGYELDNTFEWYKNMLIMWSASMKEPVKVDKYCSSIDILPTVSNLMGLSYDSRMLAGQDILSDSEGFVIFNDTSFITDRCSYNANTGEIINFTSEEVSEDYISNRMAALKNKRSMSKSICDYDYYRYIY